MKVTIYNYREQPTEIEVGDIERIKSMDVSVISGDEVLTVEYKDSTVDEFDSCWDRCICDYEGTYVIYDNDRPKDRCLLYDEDWNSSTNPQERMWM